MNAPLGKRAIPKEAAPSDGPVARGSNTIQQQAYRLLTGKDDAAFCERVSAALEQGYVLYGSPSITFNGVYTIVAQAVVRPEVARAQ